MLDPCIQWHSDEASSLHPYKVSMPRAEERPQDNARFGFRNRRSCNRCWAASKDTPSNELRPQTIRKFAYVCSFYIEARPILMRIVLPRARSHETRVMVVGSERTDRRSTSSDRSRGNDDSLLYTSLWSHSRHTRPLAHLGHSDSVLISVYCGGESRTRRKSQLWVTEHTLEVRKSFHFLFA